MNLRFFIRFAACLLTAAMLLCICGCSATDSTLEEREQLIEELYGSVELAGAVDDTTENNATTSNFVLPYSRSDNINPYSCESTLNATLSDLLYDQLIAVNSEFEAEMVMAIQIERTSSRLITVTMRDGLVFSDGTEVTGADVKYSFNAARAEGSRYAAQLANFTNCSSAGNLVYFRMAEPDPRAYMLLDFPIIKANTDYGTSVPIGSGRYVYTADIEKGTFLVRNKLWYSTNTSNVERISLVSMPTNESIFHSVEIGTVSYYYTDLRDGEPSRLNAKYGTVDINNLIYIGVNTTDPRLTQFPVREAISLTLDREEIITNAYAGRAYAATGPLTTSWPTAASAQSGFTLAETQMAVSALNEAGYVNLDSSYIRSDSNSNRLHFTMLVNESNAQHIVVAERVAAHLKNAGIQLDIVRLPYVDLRTRIAAGDYQLYLAEYALYNNMDFSDLFTPDRGLYYGLSPATTIDAWNRYLSGDAEIADVIEGFESELPFIPVCYRLGMVCFSRSLSANMDVTESDFFLHMSLWDVALADADSNPAE